MTTILKLIILPVVLVALAGWVAHHLVQTFLDDLGGPGDGTGYT